MADVRNLTGFIKVEEYGSHKPIHDREIGSVEDFCFISSPILNFEAAGSGTLNGMLSIGTSNVDVYPFIIIGEECWGQVALKGTSAVTIILKANQNEPRQSIRTVWLRWCINILCCCSIE